MTHPQDVEILVARWRHRLAERDALSEAALDELESHVWDAVERGRTAGLSGREAFLQACIRLGHEELIAAEFGKAGAGAARRKRVPMSGNYLKTAWRGLRRRPAYAFINVTGLAVGVACFILIALFVADEMSYDRFLPDGKRIFRVHETMGDTGQEWASTPWAVGDVLQAAYGERVQVARLRRRGVNVYGDVTVRRDDVQFVESGFFYADSTFFDVFALPLLKGDPRRVLSQKNALVVTESAARKYFGPADPVGQTLLINDGPHTVTGVLKDLPHHAHLRFDFLAPMHATWNPEREESGGYWRFDIYYTYVKVAHEGLSADLKALLNTRRMGAALTGTPSTFPLMRVRDIHLHSHAERELFPNSDIAYVYILSTTALFLLAIACINFVNLSTARASERAKEVGVRKVLGAERGQLVSQFMGEALLLVFSAIALGGLLAWAALPLFNNVAGKELAPGAVDLWWVPILLLALGGTVGLLAGSYPALVMSRFEPVRALKGHGLGEDGNALLRRGLVVAQFAISTFLIISTLVIYSQLSHLQGANLGFDNERVLVIPVRNVGKMNERFPALRMLFSALPDVHAVTGSNTVPGKRIVVDYMVPEGAPPEDSLFGIRSLNVDGGFVDTYGLEILHGRNFSEAHPTDTTGSFIINEAAVRALGWEDPIGKTARFTGQDGQIIGVVRDFNYASLRDEVEPLVLDLSQFYYYSFVSVKLKPGDVAQAVARVEGAWNTVLPDEPFEYFFLDDGFDQLYRNELTLRRTFTIFSSLAIFVACLGLFGLAAHTAQRRTKEIGVRKALGATAPGITLLLLKDFLKPVAAAFVIAAPLAYLALSGWLETFAYRIEVGPGLILLSGLLALLVAVVTVGYQSLKAALANPVKSLRYE